MVSCLHGYHVVTLVLIRIRKEERVLVEEGMRWEGRGEGTKEIRKSRDKEISQLSHNYCI